MRSGWVGEPHEFHRVRSLFLTGLGLVYAAAFLSLWSQVSGLVGPNGILPVADTLAYLDEHGHGFLDWPTLLWLSPDGWMLHLLCGLGAFAALLVVAGCARLPALGLCWLAYLSIYRVGWEFLGYQWDVLLLETGFLALFLAPRALWPRRAAAYPPSVAAIWLLRFLFFRLLLASGLVKLLSGDPLWRDLTALTVHYETQPLPTVVGWHAHRLPVWFHRASCAAMFAIELGAPLLLLVGRRARLVAAGLAALLQVLILLTGNYGFFNLLALLLCVPLLDDAALGRRGDPPPGSRRPPAWLVYARAAAVSAVAIFAAFICVRGLARVEGEMGTPWAQIGRWRIASNYGLFAVMTRERYEIEIEGSADGLTWSTYRFRYKPGDVKRAPAFCQPHMPRLDWAMWFEALPPWRHSAWFQRFLGRLHEGAPEVLALLEENPFPDAPPRFLRASLFRYSFAGTDEHRSEGVWWKREFVTLYVSPHAR